MKEEDILLYAALAVGGYIIYKNFFGVNDKPQQTTDVFISSGYQASTIKRMSGQTSTAVDVQQNNKNVRYFFDEGQTLNLAQKLLLRIGVPARYLLE